MAQPLFAAPASPGSPSRSPHNSSDFVLLTTERSPLLPSSPRPPPHLSASTLARPRFWWLLELTCVLDSAVTLSAGLAVPLSALPRSAVALALARPVFVASVVGSRRVRECGVLMVAQVLVSLLVLLYRVNELVQRSATPPPSLSPLPYALSRISPTFGHLLNPTSRWYFISFAFSLLHYALFAIVVGVRRRRNPFAGRAGGMRRSGAWVEQRWEGREEAVPSAGGRGRTHSRASRASAPLSSEGSVPAMGSPQGDTPASPGEVEEELDTEGEDLDAEAELDGSSSEDEDDIIDIPRHPGESTLRNRTSRMSLWSAREGSGNPSSPERERVGLRASKRFGSMRSLAGI
ncbi:hypothetical protein JCM10213_004442 [Rhodosporidiobolus nylandii]